MGRIGFCWSSRCPTASHPSLFSSSNIKNERTNVLISFWKRNQNILVSFPNLSCWEQIASIWSRICSPGPNRNDLFRAQTQPFWFHSFRCQKVCGTCVERLFLYCFDITDQQIYKGETKEIKIKSFVLCSYEITGRTLTWTFFVSSSMTVRYAGKTKHKDTIFQCYFFQGRPEGHFH